MPKRLPKISIILLNWNGKKDTLECLSSLQKVDYPNFQTIIVDNGSTDDSVAAIRTAFPHIPILENRANLGFAGGNNIGIEWVLRHHAEWILLLNNDTIVDPKFLHAFLQAAEEEPKAKILGAKILRYSHPHIIDHLGGFWNGEKGEFESPDAGQTDHPYLRMRQADYVCGAALFMHRSVPQTIGLLEPNFFLLERNCPPLEKKQLYRKILLPEIWKMARHYLLKSPFANDPVRLEKVRRYKAGCAGVIDYFRGRFGNCPGWLLKK